MSLLLGALASLFIGFSDTFGRASARRANSISHVVTQMGVGFLVAAPIAIAMGSKLVGIDVLKGAISGALIATGLAIVYRAMADSSSAIAAPVGAVLSAIIPLVWDLFEGATLEPLATLGCIVAIASLALTTYSPAHGSSALRGLGLAAAGGVLLGLAVAVGGDTDPDAGAWPAASQRAAGFVAMLGLARMRNAPPMLPPGVRRFGVLGGLAGGIGMVCWIVGAQQGDLGLVSVIASTYPAVVAVLATRFDDDTIEWWQAIGIAGAIAGSILIALA